MKTRLAIIVMLNVICCIGMYAKSTMEMLINKEWYEIDMKKFEIREGYYIKYTGTQRMTVGADENGNTKARIQQYYLSNEKTEIFDHDKVGKNRDGKYLILQGKKHIGYTDAVCMELYQLDDMNMRIVDTRHDASQQHCYVISPEMAGLEKEEEHGTVISTQDLLVGKMWYEVDLKTRKRLRTEVKYEKDGMALFCTMAENYKRELPDWQMREFYLSDNIEYEFDHSRIGDRENGMYLVVKEKGTDGKWYAANYDITTLSANRLVLDCVYPQNVPTRIFMTRSALEASNRTSAKPQQWQLTENVWHRLDTLGDKRVSVTERFNDTQLTRVFPIIKNGIRDTLVITNSYYLSNDMDSVFDFRKVGKTAEGDYLVANERTTDGDRMAVNYMIDYLDTKNMILSTVIDSVEHVLAYERELSTYEQEQILADKQDSIKGKTTLDRLSGRQWRFAKKPYATMSKWHRWYFTDSLWAEVDFVYDEFKKEWNASVKSREFYVADWVDQNFDGRQMTKKYENGKYINFYSYQKYGILVSKAPTRVDSNEPIPGFRDLIAKVTAKRSYCYEIKYLSDFLFVYHTVPIEFNPQNKIWEVPPKYRIFQYTLRSD